MSDRPAEPIPRHVRPRKHSDRARKLNIITVTENRVTSEHATGDTGATLSLLALPGILKSAPPSLVVCKHHARVFRMLNEAFLDDPLWDWRITVQHKALRDPRFTIDEVNIQLTGWKSGGRKGGRWHHFLDPSHFGPYVPWPKTFSLYELGCDVRSFLAENGLAPTARAGGIAAQLLRHPDIYTEPRRQVPIFINDQARHALPGNHYQFVDGDRNRDYPVAWYLDQETAHHQAAHTILLPHADHLVAVGRHKAHKHTDPADKIWLPNDDLDGFLMHHPKGLLYVRLKWTGKRPGLSRSLTDPAPPWYKRLFADGTALAYVYTNELDILDAYGVEIDYLIAAWVSTQRDESLPFYAEWALLQSKRAEGIRRLWLKPTLHAVYGMLAARTTQVEFVRKQGQTKKTTVTVDSQPVTGHASRRHTFVPPIANVVQRGMIEAETRKRSCLLALGLRCAGYRVLSIYADGVIVEPRHDDGRVPKVPGIGPWSPKHHLTHLRYADETRFLSAEVVKWPGTPTQNRPVIEPEKERSA